MTWTSILSFLSALVAPLVKAASYLAAFFMGKRSAEKAHAEDLAEKRKRELDAAVNSPRDPAELADRLRNGGGF